MVFTRTSLGFSFIAPVSRQYAFVGATNTAVRSRRVRHRQSSNHLQHSTAAAAGPSPPLNVRNWSRLRRMTVSYHRNSAKGVPVGPGVRSVRESPGGSSKSSTSGGGGGTGVINDATAVNTSRNRMMAAAKRRRWREVLDILGRWEEHSSRLDAKTYNVALSSLGKCGRWKEALATLDRMRSKGVSPDVFSFNSTISACGRAGKWKQALALLSEMESEGSRVPPDLYSYNGAISAVAKDGRWQQALDLLMGIRARGFTPDVFSFSSAMSACDRAGEWQRALEIMDLMLRRNIEPNIVSYGTAISACARGGRWQKALSLLADIPSRGLEPNAHVYGSAIHACVVGGEHGRALALLEEMLERGVVPDATVFAAAMTAVDGWGAALRLLEVMKRKGVLPDLRTYNAALKVIARSGREDVALALLNRMTIDGCSPDIVSFNTAIDACVPREKWQEAVELLEVDMPAAKVKPDVISFTSVIHSCAGPNGNWEKAYQLLDTMWQDSRGARPNKRTYDLVIQACGHGGEWELGVTLIDDMRDLGIKPDAQTFNIAVAACARSGEKLAAETLVANMWNARITPDEFTYASLVAACGRAKEWKRATEIFDEARYVHRIRPSLQIYGALLGCLADGERWAEVLVYLDRMESDGVIPDAAATNTAVLAAAELGDGRRALSLLDGKAASRRGLRRPRRVAAAQDVGDDEDNDVHVRAPGDGQQRQAGTNVETRESASSSTARGGSPRHQVGGEGAREVCVGPVVSDEQLASSSGCKEAAATEGSRVIGSLSAAAGDKESEVMAVAPGSAQPGGRGGRRDSDSMGGIAGGGWEAATPGLLSSVLHALHEAGEDVTVLEAVERGREEGVLLTLSIYRCALMACGNLGDHVQANALLSRMTEELLTPDIVHWNHALRASASCARWEEARLRLREMEDSGTSPDEFSYRMALKACSAGLWSGDSWSQDNGWGAKEEDNASSITQISSSEGRRYGGGKGEGGRGSPPCRGEHAIELLGEMKRKGFSLSARSFTLAMAACLESHRDRRVEGETGSHQNSCPPAADLRLSEAALSLFDELLEAGEVPTASTYAFALKACARSANARRAHDLFWAMVDAPAPPAMARPPSTSSSSSSSRKEALPEEGALQNSVLHTPGMQRLQVSSGPDLARLEVRPWHLASAIAAFDAAGDWDGAQELWDEALRRGVSPRSPGYEAAISAAMRAGDAAAAHRLVEEARGLGLTISWSDKDFGVDSKHGERA